MIVPFWSNNPSILFNTDDLTKIWPTLNMTLEEKLNAISRMVIYVSILGFLFTMNINFLLVCIVTLALIYLFYKLIKNNIIQSLQDGFTNKNQNQFVKKFYINKGKEYITNPVTLENVLSENYYPVTKKNPLGNVLLTDIMDNPNKKPAPPSFNPDVYEDITRNSKKTVQYLNPGIKNTNKQLFGDLAQNFEFDWSMWNFYSMPNTRVTNDQGSYAEYLYGNMPSCKDGNAFACVQDNLRYILI
jgi:hypothetical protein